ncbi:uncharacterized protein OCT59_011963 [Rhizophagus irregularis]|uniref:Uncharacterized protein n=4 Tax=Rhizophagus irregularis TaxID=588596 RepID=U9TUU9_RHIID|nr:hypothetical protein GLOIN_2v1470679 [Rhizophagus irregularis DAOM 181602=DAOM 197198]EXX60727.1 hypothetical protein RirG_177430 [Rhizophagus irregularis DAOM 197198w]UZO00848.1 hypothetical protein OCT59_011963 [Rhizophagus irregularis]POG81571.1 hypothetical protein GLOIN_2v1470679 [Rhizophagus irregularis DAOM 181602=DAOM 197198]CAG8493480.1 17376_t:CDS:1 [Rhizophagus irregularis]GBC39734.2 hypothetical protein GLOIN_2v1470679 [Rhizophagus irregularis DAOM 181602=DAOM 197198]|eukprot:XP_025188437.1 hypothetical protein GLOIN_2v1470679 [Rhizophagus irregularis DAOM 181602=DAOM 197198]
MNFYRNKHQKIKHNVRNNQAEDDEYPSQSSLNDYSDVYKQELTKCEKELSEITVKFNRMKENNYELEVKVQKLEDDLLQERKKNNFIIEKNQKEKQELDSKLKILEENYQRDINQLNGRYNELESSKKNTERYMESCIKNLEQQLRDQRIKFQQEFKQAHEKYKKNINYIRQNLDEKGNGSRDLEDENARLKEEASKYQSALGVATNIFLSDGDLNHSVKLKNDILKLQNILENYVTHLKPNMNINIKKVQELAQEYGCLNEITANNSNKIFIKAILQRKVLDLICEFSHEFFKFQCGNSKLESDVESKATELLELIKLFLTTRAGTDEVTGASIIKIRQQVYGILGNRGFNNIIDNDGNMRMHDFIAHVSNELNKMMNNYRKINDLNRKKQVDAMAPKLIQDIFKLLWFRINVQEPKLECEFFENDMINPNLMKGAWNDDEIDKLRVDICYFPLIGTKLNSSDAKIYTLAKVFPRYISASSEANEKVYE